MQKTEAYFDDFIVHGTKFDECIQYLQARLQRLYGNDLHTNKHKCTFMTEKVEYLSYVIQQNKISKSPAKVQEIQEIYCPHYFEELKRFLGIIRYYSRFVPDFSTMTFPLR